MKLDFQCANSFHSQESYFPGTVLVDWLLETMMLRPLFSLEFLWTLTLGWKCSDSIKTRSSCHGATMVEKIFTKNPKVGKFKAATLTLPFLKCILKHMITNKARKQGSASFAILKVARHGIKPNTCNCRHWSRIKPRVVAGWFKHYFQYSWCLTVRMFEILKASGCRLFCSEL